MEGSGEDEIVIGVQLVEAVAEVAVVDETAGLVDDDEGQDTPIIRSMGELAAGLVWFGFVSFLPSSSVHARIQPSRTYIVWSSMERSCQSFLCFVALSLWGAKEKRLMKDVTT